MAIDTKTYISNLFKAKNLNVSSNKAPAFEEFVQSSICEDAVKTIIDDTFPVKSYTCSFTSIGFMSSMLATWGIKAKPATWARFNSRRQQCSELIYD